MLTSVIWSEEEL